MDVTKQAERAHAFRARLRRLAPDLHAEESLGKFCAVASYLAEDGSRIFSFCLDGLLVEPDCDARFVRYSEIESTSYYGTERLKQEKSGHMSRALTLTLRDGTSLALQLRAPADCFSERLKIGNLIEQRVRLANADRK